MANSLLTRLIVGMMLFLFLFSVLNQSSRSKQLPPDIINILQLKSEIASGNVKELKVRKITLYRIDGVRKIVDASKPESFTADLTETQLNEISYLSAQNNVPLIVPIPSNGLFEAMLLNLFWIVLFFGAYWYFVIRNVNKQQSTAFSFGKSKAKKYQSNEGRKTFADVAGCDEAKEEVREVVEFLKNPKKFQRLGARIPRGVLLYGSPGTGKTLLAKAVAGEANVSFLSASGSEFVEMFVGMGAARVRDLFEKARSMKPCVVFIDEIDAVGKKRGVAIGGGHDEREQTLNAILTELDGFNTGDGIVVMAATNRPDILDEALIRPGRFDRQIEVPKPDLAGREMILKIHSRKVPLAENIDLLSVAKDTAGMVGADLENVVNEATMFATRKDKKQVENSDFSEAVDKVSMGPMRKSMKLTEKAKNVTAYHEAGHTLIAKLIPEADPVHKVTIIPRGPALGFTKQLPNDDRYSITQKQLEAMVLVCLGGRAAEELVFNEITTGHSNDFEKATHILKKMIYEFGMDGEAGLAVYKEKTDFWGNPAGLDASQKTKEKLEARLEDILKKKYDEVKELLNKNRSKLDALVKALLEKETLQAEDIDQVINSA
ncbi:MAG: ATP-dependent zinc metalloprotease FtsH [bacterium]|nr:ATP-dependent zinc metalloprotease FtsH [bacterium]